MTVSNAVQSTVETPWKPVPGTRSPIGWLGEKSRLVAQIVPLIPNHETYVEVFAGAAWMLFRKPESHVEVINDANRDLITLYRVVKHHLDEMVRQLRWLLVSRDEFQRFLDTPADTLTDVQRAVRFYYLMRTGFGGKAVKQTFGYAASQPPRFNILRVEEDLSAAHIRLARVYVENQRWQQMLDRYDRPASFFYLDPPYYGSENDYGPGLFDRADFSAMAARLAEVKGRFIVSLNDRPEVREIFAAFFIKSVATRYSVNVGSAAPVRELLIANWKLPP